ncbi:hypothetical protein MOQ_001139 [Trypanosoma cruzi marinkellei]|uniref:Uncharacterized protein n=1 Tax=Trypanosoma cruzi marinkellei TaxID=85056 RepID=K2PC93_TRYCR|nr:hypothetical protein MOQ_001139 [Trypanosoma cruzi marinkellei]
MSRSKTRKTPRGLPEVHHETIAALNEMEENLRRLGLCNEKNSATDGHFHAGGAQDYVAPIWKAKEEATKLRHEKEYRQFAAEEQKRENEKMLLYAKREEALQDVIKKAKELLEKETDVAHDAMSRRAQKMTDRSIRAEELQRQRVLRDRVHRAMKGTEAEQTFCQQTLPVVDEEMRTLKKQAKAAAVREYCHFIASGLVELAMRVAENVYTIGAVDDVPVLRFPRDLPTSRWRAWVEELIFSKMVPKPMSELLATTPLRELCDPNYNVLSGQKEEGFGSSLGGSENNGRGTLESARDIASYGDRNAVATDAAVEHILKRLVEMQHNYENNLVNHSVHDAIRLIKKHEKKRLRIELDEIRRQHEAQCPEEVVPGWTHRMPPAGCFVHGDELSGLKKFVEAACAEALQEVVQAPPLHKRRLSLAAMPDTAKVVTEAESAKSEAEPYRVLTPNMLFRTQQSFPGQGGVGGGMFGGGGGGSSNFLTSNSKTLRGLATGVSTAARTKEGRQTEELTESSQYIDALSDLLARELAAVHQHNLQLVMRSGATTTEPKVGTRGTPCTLFLVGFPETETFLRTLNQKLHNALEFVEHEIIRALRAEEASERSPPVPQPARGKNLQKGPTTSHDDAAGSRKKGGKQMTSAAGKRGAGRAPIQWNEEENLPPHPRVFPPLCILGIFLQYDVPSRRRRMQQMYLHPTPPSAEPKGQKTTANNEEGGESYADWTIGKLHHELIQQDKKMRNVCKTWCTNVSKASVAVETMTTRVPSAEKQKKRSRPSVTNKAVEALTVNATAAPNTPSVTVPKVLFFWRKEDITSLPDSCTSTESITATVSILLSSIFQFITTSGRLVRGQLVPPLRLSDYRFLPAALTQLVELQQRFHCRWKENIHHYVFSPMSTSALHSPKKTTLSPRTDSVTPPPSLYASPLTSGEVGNFVSACPICIKEKSVAVEYVVLLETEMHRVFCTFFADLLQFITQNAFPSSLWIFSRDPSNMVDQNNSNGVETLSRTLHFLSIDKNYDNSREALYTLLVSGMTQLSAICALLLHCVMDVALKSMGEALARLCFWARRHVSITTTQSPETEKPPVPPSATTTPNIANIHVTVKEEVEGAVMKEGGENEEEGKSTATKCGIPYDAVKDSFLASVPRLGFDKVQSMVELLDGRATSFAEFQQELWSYASCLHQKMLECFRSFINNASAEFNDENTESLTATASQVTEVLVASLFAFSPVEKSPLNFPDTLAHSNYTSELFSSTITVSIGRAMASIRALRRCCAVASLCAARWIDAMYATALKIPPHGCFPAECRPTDIASIFCSPTIVTDEGCAPPPSLAYQLLASRSSALHLSPDEECDCWWETEMEVILQIFSIYQKPTLNEAEFTHCAMQVQFNTMWRFLPPRALAIAERLGIFLPLTPRVVQEEKRGEEQQRAILEFALPRFTDLQCYRGLKKPFLKEEDASRIFIAAVQAQQQKFPASLNALDSPFSSSSQHAAVSNGAVRKGWMKKPLLHLREYCISVLLQRLCLHDPSGAITCQSHVSGLQEPSTMQLRQMIKSLPRAVREQGPDSMPESGPISMEEWKRIRWWPFYEDASLAKAEAFVQRYLLRLLRVCFGFVNGELCSRPAPFLPDIIHIAAGTRGCQATLERYFHALSALDAVRKKKLRHSQETGPMNGSSEALKGGDDAAVLDGPLLAFDFALSVDEAMFFFQRTGETSLRGPCARGLSYGSPNHLCELRDPMPSGDWSDAEEEAVGNYEDEEDDDVLPLATELTLLLEEEGCPALTLTLLGSSHWGIYITPRLTAIPFNVRIATAEKGRMDEMMGLIDCSPHCNHGCNKESSVSFL